MSKTLSPRVHPGGQTKHKDAVCRWCWALIKGHPICARCSLLIHDAGVYVGEGGYDPTGSDDGVVCLGCASRKAVGVSAPRPNIRCSVCFARSRLDEVPKGWIVGSTGELICRHCVPSESEPDDMPRESVQTRTRADVLLEELSARPKRKKLKYKPLMTFRYY